MNFVERISSFTAWATARCNLACRYCYVYKLYEDQPKKTMDEESIRSMLEFAKRSSLRPFRIWWFGGEPLVAWKEVVVRAVEIASEMGLRIPEDVSFGFTTNATLLDEDKVKFMARYRMGVLLSIDGTKEIHDKYRVYHDGRGSFDDVWRNINLVRKHLNPNPELRVTVHPSNFKHLTSIVEFFVENGLTTLACDPVYECKYYEEDYEILRKELLKLRSKMIQWARNGAVPMLLMARKPVEVERALSGQWTWTDRCGLGTGNVGVDVNGDVYPCHRFVSSHDKSISLGNVNESI
ncbi:MAG: radical SAM protein, partial [Nitrososphaerota archaeon]